MPENTSEPVEEHDHHGPSSDRLAQDQVIRQFVEHWGMMARSWGINSTMGELFAVLYVTGDDWTAEDLRRWLRVSRGNVSMNLRELLNWGVVHKTHRPGERREFFRAESDVWVLFRRILAERKRRELDPTLTVLERTVNQPPTAASEPVLRERITRLHRFFSMINALACRLLTLDPNVLEELESFLQPMHDDPDET